MILIIIVKEVENIFTEDNKDDIEEDRLAAQVNTRDYKYIRPLKDDIYLVYLKSRMGLLCTNFVHFK